MTFRPRADNRSALEHSSLGADRMADHSADDSPAVELPRPEPVMDQARVTAGVTGALSLLAGVAVAAGWVSTGEADELQASLIAATGAVIGVINVAVVFWRARKARAAVTPLADPRGAAGEQLIALPAARVLVAANAANAPLPTQADDELAPIDASADSTVVTW